MKIKITDDMVDAALIARANAIYDGSGKMRAALEAAAPIIADQVLERVAQEYARHPVVSAAIRALKEPTP